MSHMPHLPPPILLQSTKQKSYCKASASNTPTKNRKFHEHFQNSRYYKVDRIAENPQRNGPSKEDWKELLDFFGGKSSKQPRRQTSSTAPQISQATLNTSTKLSTLYSKQKAKYSCKKKIQSSHHEITKEPAHPHIPSLHVPPFPRLPNSSNPLKETSFHLNSTNPSHGSNQKNYLSGRNEVARGSGTNASNSSQNTTVDNQADENCKLIRSLMNKVIPKAKLNTSNQMNTTEYYDEKPQISSRSNDFHPFTNRSIPSHKNKPYMENAHPRKKRENKMIKTVKYISRTPNPNRGNVRFKNSSHLDDDKGGVETMGRGRYNAHSNTQSYKNKVKSLHSPPPLKQDLNYSKIQTEKDDGYSALTDREILQITKADIDVKLGQALLDFSDIKNNYYNQTITASNTIRKQNLMEQTAREAKTSWNTKRNSQEHKNRPTTESGENSRESGSDPEKTEKMKERLIIAERLMKKLYARNRFLEKEYKKKETTLMNLTRGETFHTNPYFSKTSTSLTPFNNKNRTLSPSSYSQQQQQDLPSFDEKSRIDTISGELSQIDNFSNFDTKSPERVEKLNTTAPSNFGLLNEQTVCPHCNSNSNSDSDIYLRREKDLLIQLEEKTNQIFQLQEDLNLQHANNEKLSKDQYINFLKSRLEQLIKDSQRYFHNYVYIRDNYLKMMSAKNRSLMSRFPSYKKESTHNTSLLSKLQSLTTFQNDSFKKHNSEQEEHFSQWEKRLSEFESTKTQLEKKIEGLEEDLLKREEIDEKIEKYVARLVEQNTNIKNENLKLLEIVEENGIKLEVKLKEDILERSTHTVETQIYKSESKLNSMHSLTDAHSPSKFPHLSQSHLSQSHISQSQISQSHMSESHHSQSEHSQSQMSQMSQLSQISQAQISECDNSQLHLSPLSQLSQLLGENNKSIQIQKTSNHHDHELSFS